MDHQAVLDRNLIERYILGELSVADSTELEAHYFECARCTEDVRLAEYFISNLKAVLREEEAVRELIIQADRPFLDVSIRLKTKPTSSAIDCEALVGGTVVPIESGLRPSEDCLRIRLQRDLLESGPFTIILREEGSSLELESHRFVLKKS